ncbi:MAG TPA: hypothetical protein VFQ25_08195 [Ktedonobacterales bacterium]|nr:hypothetical protein [Ktedonobacterales bacterium]
MTVTLARALLEYLRGGGDEADAARARLAAGAQQGDELRGLVASALAAELRPSDRAITRWLLEQETAAHEARGAGASEALHTLIAALARFGQLSDAMTLWRARQATMETRAGVDPEQFARAGLSATQALLAELSRTGGPEAAEARAALDWLNESQEEGAFDDLPAYFAWSDERYGLQINGPT